MPFDYLLIDDDIDDQEFFIMALEKIDSNITCAVEKDCTRALEKLKTFDLFPPRYIFLDINMHKMSGLDCLIELRKYPHLSNSKIIMYSTSSDKKIIEKSKELGANDYLVKPPSIKILVENLTDVIKKNSDV